MKSSGTVIARFRSSQDGKVRLVSRNQNDLTGEFPELHELSKLIKAKNAVLDGEIVALDEQGRASFSLMQQRTGIRKGGRRVPERDASCRWSITFSICFISMAMICGGLRWSSASKCWRRSSHPVNWFATPIIFLRVWRYSKRPSKKGWRGFSRRSALSHYEERRSREWLKIKVTQTIDCVVGGYTDPEGSRQYFGSIVLGLYDEKGRLIHVGQAGTGFNQAMLKEIWQLLKELETNRRSVLR